MQMEADDTARDPLAAHAPRRRRRSTTRTSTCSRTCWTIGSAFPGTAIRFGLDGIVGFIPGVGDVIGGIASCVIIIAAWARGVSYVTLARMLANWGIEVLLGTVPVLGNLFDIGWKANRRNYALLTGSLADPQGVRRRSWLFFAGLCACWRRCWCCRCCCWAGCRCIWRT